MSKNGSRMSKKTKQLLVFLAVLAVIGVGVALLILLPSGEPAGNTSSGAPSASSSQAIHLIKRDPAEMKSISFTNEHGTVELISHVSELENPDSSSGGTIQSVSYTVTGMEGVTILNSTAQTFAAFGFRLDASRDLGEQNDLPPFGLDYPAAKYTAVFDDGTETTVLVGDAVPGSADQYYTMIEGEKNVYLCGLGLTLSVSDEKFLSNIILGLKEATQSGTEELPTFDKIRISGRDHEKTVVIFPRPEELPETSPLSFASYYISEPAESAASSTFAEDYLNPLSTLTSTGLAAVNPTEDELKKFGFDDAITLEFWVKNEKTTLVFGDVNKSVGYVMFENGKVIYEVNPADIRLVTDRVFQMRDALMYLCNISTVAQIRFVDDTGKEFLIRQDRTEVPASSGASSAEDGKVNYDYAAFYNDEELKYYKKFYQSFLSCYREEEVPDDAELGKQLFSFTLSYYDEFKTEPVTLSAYEYSDRRVVYQINGVNMALVKSSWAEKVLADFEKMIRNEPIVVI